MTSSYNLSQSRARMTHMLRQLGQSVCTHILFMHEPLGCETNPTCMTFIKQPPPRNSKPLMTSVSQLHTVKNDLACTYNRNTDEDHYSITIFAKWLLLALLMSQAAAKYHMLCVYYHAQQCKGTVYNHLSHDLKCKESDFLSKLTYHQLHRNTYMLPDAFTTQIEAVCGAHARSITLSGAMLHAATTKDQGVLNHTL